MRRSDEERALDLIVAVLSRIDRGAGFAENRGFPWTAGMEREAGLDELRETLEAAPALAALLPTLTALLRDPDAVIGLGRVPIDEAVEARRRLEED